MHARAVISRRVRRRLRSGSGLRRVRWSRCRQQERRSRSWPAGNRSCERRVGACRGRIGWRTSSVLQQQDQHRHPDQQEQQRHEALHGRSFPGRGMRAWPRIAAAARSRKGVPVPGHATLEARTPCAAPGRRVRGLETRFGRPVSKSSRRVPPRMRWDLPFGAFMGSVGPRGTLAGALRRVPGASRTLFFPCLISIGVVPWTVHSVPSCSSSC